MLDYYTYVSLVQNEDRVLRRRSVAHLNALEAQGDGELGVEWGDAVAWDASGAWQAVEDANAARALARARRMMR